MKIKRGMLGLVKKNKKRLIIFFLVFLLAAVLSVRLSRKPAVPTSRTATEGAGTGGQIAGPVQAPGGPICPGCVRRRIDGRLVEPGRENLFPVAVMIENHVDARPQAGLAQASLVYEAEAEGGITRFLAIFAGGEDIKKIGPVRSAREYYLNWAKELGGLYVHCGGSPEALADIPKLGILDFDEFFRGGYFWRDQARSAPHNLYTSSELLERYLREKGRAEGDYQPWRFKDDQPPAEAASSSILIVFKAPDSVVEWKYDRGSDSYLRYQAGQPHLDADGRQITAKNVVIQFVRSKIIDEKLRLRLDNIGSGGAEICQDGNCRPGSWKKDSAASRTRYYYGDGEEAVFDAGPIWVEVVAKGRQVNF